MRVSNAEGKLGGKALVLLAVMKRRSRNTIQTEGGLQGWTADGLQKGGRKVEEVEEKKNGAIKSRDVQPPGGVWGGSKNRQTCF